MGLHYTTCDGRWDCLITLSIHSTQFFTYSLMHSSIQTVLHISKEFSQKETPGILKAKCKCDYLTMPYVCMRRLSLRNLFMFHLNVFFKLWIQITAKRKHPLFVSHVFLCLTVLATKADQIGFDFISGAAPFWLIISQ